MNRIRAFSPVAIFLPQRYGMRGRAGAAVVYAGLAVLLAIPMLVATVPLGADDLNHLARIYIRAHIDSDPDLARVYRVKTDLIPYLGMDLLLTPLARVLPIMVLGRLYILALVWGLVAAVAVLQRAFTGRVGLGSLAVGLVAYSGMLAWGLLNYLLGLILALLAFAAWHSWRERPWLRRLALFTCAATALYLIHLLGFVLYGVLVVSYELLGRRQPWRTPPLDWTVLAGQAIPGLVLWATFSGNVPTGEHAAHYWLLAKLLTFELPFLFGGAAGGPDVGSVIFLFAAIALLLGAHRGWLEWPRALTGPLLALMALAIALPFRVVGVSLIDYRFPLAATCLALAGIGPTPRSRLSAAPVAVAILALTAIRVSDVSFLMYRCDRQYEEVRDALAGLPRGSELLTVVERTEPVPGAACTSVPIYEHIAQLITIDRSGYAPDFFAHVTSVAVRGGRASDTDPIAADTFTIAPTSGYVLWIHLGHRRLAPPGLVPIHRGSFFDIWQPQLTPAASPPPPAPPAPSARVSSPSG